jgi:predicted nucleic-acid-binding protein
MRAIDTNVLVRLLARDAPEQTAAAEAFVAQGAWVSCLVLAETVWVLESVYAFDKQQIHRVVAMLLEHLQLVLQDTDAVRTALEAFGTHAGVGFTDCLIAAVAGHNGHAPVGTFDKKIARLGDVQELARESKP